MNRVRGTPRLSRLQEPGRKPRIFHAQWLHLPVTGQVLPRTSGRNGNEVRSMRRLALALLFLALLAPFAYANEQPLVAIMPFEEGRIEGEYKRRWWQRDGAALLDAIRTAGGGAVSADGNGHQV